MPEEVVCPFELVSCVALPGHGQDQSILKEKHKCPDHKGRQCGLVAPLCPRSEMQMIRPGDCDSIREGGNEWLLYSNLKVQKIDDYC